MARHARHADDKQARRDSILMAARDLFLRSPEHLPSSAQIAEASGLAKGTVYLYFRSKEEIFMALLHAENMGMLKIVREVFASGEQISVDHKIAAFLRTYVEYLRTHLEVLQLEAMQYAVLEPKVAKPVLDTYQAESLRELYAASQAVERGLSLPDGSGVRLLTHTYALTRGLWQSLGRISADAEDVLKRSGTPLELLFFIPEIEAALQQYWRGLEQPQRSHRSVATP